ncbi:MAG: hypothetical protein PF689_08610 [Deltaproteobacteria bacterium]|jgi:hypothetical protein|nr:hypothetical protein [Deltaproteobacteria bacterium]
MKSKLNLTCSHCDKTSKVEIFFQKKDDFFVICSICSHETPVEVHYKPTSNIAKTTSPILKTDQPVICPKCNYKSYSEESCPKCGLIYEKWTEKPKELFYFNNELKIEWKKIKKLPVDNQPHDLFLENCFKHNALNEAVRAYKTLAKSGQDPSKRIKQLEILANMAISKNKQPDKKTYEWLKILMLLLFALFFLLLWKITPDDLL